MFPTCPNCHYTSNYVKGDAGKSEQPFEQFAFPIPGKDISHYRQELKCPKCKHRFSSDEYFNQGVKHTSKIIPDSFTLEAIERSNKLYRQRIKREK